MDKYLMFYTGAPCSGKSILMEGMVNKLGNAEMIDDYQFFSEWAKREENQHHIQVKGD